MQRFQIKSFEGTTNDCSPLQMKNCTNGKHDEEGTSGKEDDGKRSLDCNRLLPTTFPARLHELLEKASNKGFESVVSWLRCGNGFIVHDKAEFQRSVLQTSFKQTQYKSFVRQLNLYGFQRICDGKTKGGYTHQWFRRDNVSLCRFITRQGVKIGKRSSDPPRFLSNPNASVKSEEEQIVLPEPIGGRNSRIFGMIPSDIADAIIDVFH
jgi:hypothetical protein